MADVWWCCVAMQAMTYDQGGRTRRVVRLQLVHAVSAALEKVLALKDGTIAEGARAAGEDGSHKADSEAGSHRGSSKGSDGGDPLTAEPSAVQQPTAHPSGGKKLVGGFIVAASVSALCCASLVLLTSCTQLARLTTWSLQGPHPGLGQAGQQPGAR